jgi:hypothetical protein
LDFIKKHDLEIEILSEERNMYHVKYNELLVLYK